MNTFIKKKKLFHILSAIILVTSSAVYAVTAESQAKKARAAKGNKVIRCSMDGKNGTSKLEDVVAKIKDGTTLIITPGLYLEHPIVIYSSKVIITSEFNKYPPLVTLELHGKDCIVKKLNISTLKLYQSTTITDSVVYEMRLNSDPDQPSRGNLNLYAYNTAFNLIYIDFDIKLNAYFSHSVIKNKITWPHNQRGFFEKSILYSKDELFSIHNFPKRKNGRIEIKDCMIYADVYGSYTKKGGKPRAADSFKELTKIWHIFSKGKQVLKKPIFLGKSPFLAENSPGQGIGLIPDEHPFYEYYKKKAKKQASKKKGAKGKQ